MRKSIVLVAILITCIPWIATCGVGDSASEEESLPISSCEDSSQSNVSFGAISSSGISVNSSLSSENSSSFFDISSSSSPYSVEDSVGHSSHESASSSVSNATYRISYYIKTLDGKTQAVPDEMWVENGNYPITYTVGESKTVSALENAEYPLFTLEFLGWYCDSACTIPFYGIVGTVNEGDITLHAQVRRVAK